MLTLVGIKVQGLMWEKDKSLCSSEPTVPEWKGMWVRMHVCIKYRKRDLKSDHEKLRVTFQGAFNLKDEPTVFEKQTQGKSCIN